MVTYANDDDDDDYDEGIRGITNGYVLIKTLVVTMRTRWDASYSSLEDQSSDCDERLVSRQFFNSEIYKGMHCLLPPSLHDY